LNYINGYVVKASDCIDFSAKEYSEGDKDGAEHTDWKRTYRMLLKSSPCLQEIFCFMSADVFKELVTEQNRQWPTFLNLSHPERRAMQSSVYSGRTACS
jgi:hypothetical protein